MSVSKFIIFSFILLSITACNEDIDQAPLIIYGTWESNSPNGQHGQTVESFIFLQDGTFENSLFIRDPDTMEKLGYMVSILGNFRVEENVLVTYDLQFYIPMGNDVIVPREELEEVNIDWEEGRRLIHLQNNNTRLILEDECVTPDCSPYTATFDKVG